MFQPAFGGDQAQEVGGKIAIGVDLLRKPWHHIFEQAKGQPNAVHGFRQHGFNFLAGLVAQWFAHAAGHRPRRMDAAAAQHADHILPKFAQANPGAGDIGIFFNQPHNIALDGITLHAKQEIRTA